MPRPRSVTDHRLCDRLASVFRVAGFEGSTMAALAAATGLQRASLYHRFPRGKAEMAEAVLAHVRELFKNALAPIADNPDAAAGIAGAAEQLGQLYEGGTLPCVMDTLSMSGPRTACARRPPR